VYSNKGLPASVAASEFQYSSNNDIIMMVKRNKEERIKEKLKTPSERSEESESIPFCLLFALVSVSVLPKDYHGSSRIPEPCT
jgi:hypothetical protein